MYDFTRLLLICAPKLWPNRGLPDTNKDFVMFFDFPKQGGRMEDVLGDPNTIPCLNHLRGYYDGLRLGGALPHRVQIDPNALGQVLANSFLIERIAPGMGRFRLAGMAVQEVLGIEARNMPLSILFEPVARAQLARVLEQVFTGPTLLDLTLEAERAIGRPQLAARMILLPLRDAKGAFHQILGGFALAGTTGRAPRRFGITRMRSEDLDAPSAFTAVRTVALASALPDFDPTNFDPPKCEPTNKKPQLRLVHSRD
jgi:hypothetical protein